MSESSNALKNDLLFGGVAAMNGAVAGSTRDKVIMVGSNRPF